jgi:hypothetical protein
MARKAGRLAFALTPARSRAVANSARFSRGERGQEGGRTLGGGYHPAGVRQTLLSCLQASIDIGLLSGSTRWRTCGIGMRGRGWGWFGMCCIRWR